MKTEVNTGRVVTRFGAELLVENTEDNPDIPHVRCTAKRKFDTIVCGDYITWHHNEHGNASVDDLLPRTNALTRPGYRGRPRTIAANIDQLVIVNSWLPETSWDLVDRYLIAANQLNAEAIIVMNKSDLAEAHATEADWQAMKTYEEIGYPVLQLNAHTGEGIEQLKQMMDDKTSIFSGRSGVGKSSIANRILPTSDIAVGIISDSGEGKHTTTTADLYRLENKGYLIDSPGVRDYALGDISTQELADGYIEFAQYQNNCRFHNCTHDHEPRCAVRTAVENNEISKERYLRYLDALHTLKENSNS
ncbi:ribosome small subunit-dependent GTPase A [Cocleimonas sp. KMM 6892]|uniref:ribosome small subunit-dependent GTPase A n=1 Tax=unclassified Cocleimonas TaxID=2639732 RepID=UPI002DBA7642|nr:MULTISPECIES: ribosome small subunit-dependent GTPase A [unclassified Cocleimonas]MEB8432378.1 ribosome small subunit-dependent GTPase A [Cocleimonas sp. KMM 6892]MEC4715237.1 ribosome small subunit-dependent GTPase A [Cocleimonas sp. KMM 6895]MEC4745144.1 ribosome small subunit-dependent GTPase A [Cocleimonas sp. KMM 6896]